MPDAACPLCRDSARMKRPRTLYDHQVCKRCWSRFLTRRQLAWIIDVFAGQFVVGFVIGLVSALLNPHAGVPGLFLYAAVLGALAFKDGFAGHSLGKAICGVQVVDDASGEPAGFGRSFLRNWILIIPFMPLVVALTMNRGPRLGDGMAKTRVIWKRHRGNLVFSGPAATARVFE